MSTNIKDRMKRNRDRKNKFIEKEQDNQIGVQGQSVIIERNNIQKKQEDAYDPKQLKTNMLQDQNQKSYKSNLINFGDQDGYEPTQVLEGKQQIQQNNTPVKASTKKRQRGKRQKKQIVQSDQDENIKQQVESSAYEKMSALQEESSMKLNINQEKSLIKQQLKRQLRQQKTKHFQQQDQYVQQENEQGEQGQQQQQQQQQKESIKAQNLKANQQKLKINNKNNNYVFMHTIMNKAGYNKQQRRDAVYTPLRPGQSSFVYFKRYQNGFSQSYQVIGQDQRPILFCQNQRGCIGCNYYISLTKEMDKNNASYIGKLRGNAAGSLYQLYDYGIQPTNSLNRSNFRVSMAYIEYQSNFLGMNGPRRLKAIIPNVKNIEDFDMYKLAQDESLTNFQTPIVLKLKNKQPRWNQKLKSYALNFGGRVKQASIKNFILIKDVEQNDQQVQNLVVFGKIDQSTFALQFHHPFNLFQAFGIAMSQFDFKLKCQ